MYQRGIKTLTLINSKGPNNQKSQANQQVGTEVTPWLAIARIPKVAAPATSKPRQLKYPLAETPLHITPAHGC
jgi:hypothetical protein